jgi:hypothetical protein
MRRWLEEANHVLLQVTLIILHLITYSFIIWSVLCHHGIIDCAERTPTACACRHAAAKITPEKSAHPSRKEPSKGAKKKTAAPPRRAASTCRNKPESARK